MDWNLDCNSGVSYTSDPNNNAFHTNLIRTKFFCHRTAFHDWYSYTFRDLPILYPSPIWQVKVRFKRIRLVILLIFSLLSKNPLKPTMN